VSRLADIGTYFSCLLLFASVFFYMFFLDVPLGSDQLNFCFVFPDSVLHSIHL